MRFIRRRCVIFFISSFSPSSVRPSVSDAKSNVRKGKVAKKTLFFFVNWLWIKLQNRYTTSSEWLTSYKRLESKLDKVIWCTDPIKSYLQYWAPNLHSVITKTVDDRCDTTIYDRFTKINTDSFDGKSIHIQKAETTIYTDGSKTDHGVGAGFVIYHKKRIHAESIHMPGTSTVFQAEIEAISHACQYALANLK